MADATTHPAPLPQETRVIGKPLDRADGRLKVTGAAKYAAEYQLPGLAHAVAFVSTIARGRVTKIDAASAQSAPGVLSVITRQNAPLVQYVDRHPKPPLEGQPGQTLPLLQDDVVHYAGQFLGMVVAETLEQATYAASLVKISYDEEKPVLDVSRPIQLVGTPGKSRGDAQGAFSSAAVKIYQTYTTPIENHNPMEMHATIAAWTGDRLTLYDATQHVRGSRRVTASALDLAIEDVRVIDPFVGGGFGCKGSVWPNTYLAAIAARHVGRPVKLMLTRKQMFTQAGYRPATCQTITLGADSQGKVQSITHDSVALTSDFDEWIEGSTRPSTFVYSCSNVRTSQKLARVSLNTPTQMRAPGLATGTYALECAMDELAAAMEVDPIDLRLRNYSEMDEDLKKPYSSKSLRDCYRAGADQFGWSKRNASPRSNQIGDELIGVGMATAVYPANQSPSAAAVRFFPGGSALVTVAAHDMGTGTYTIMAQIAAEILGLRADKVRVELGDTILPSSGGAGGSRTAVSAGSAVRAAAARLVRNIAHFAADDPKSPLFGKDAMSLTAADGKLILEYDPSIGEPLTAVFSRNGNRTISGEAETSASDESQKYSGYSWGAQFAEVHVNPRFGTVRVSRWVGAFAAGRILNAKTAHSQLQGAIVMGIGMALFEQTHHDHRHGQPVNASLADYLVPVNADIPKIECFFVPERDDVINPLGAKGVGELGITGAAAAIANAVYNATGRRIRDLPITPEKLMDA
jgi:xanthine dehydrogenase YagR molybdenum-binding subunit